MLVTKPEPRAWDDELIEDMAAGRVTLTRVGYPVSLRLNAKDREAFERAKRVGYISRARRPNAENLYREWCQVHCRPVVVIRQSRKYASVSCDMLVAGYTLDSKAMAWVDEQRGRGMSSYGGVGYTVIERIANDLAEALAFRLYEVAMDCRPDLSDQNHRHDCEVV